MAAIRPSSSSVGAYRIPVLVVNSVIGAVPKAEDVPIPFHPG